MDHFWGLKGIILQIGVHNFIPFLTEISMRVLCFSFKTAFAHLCSKEITYPFLTSQGESEEGAREQRHEGEVEQ